MKYALIIVGLGNPGEKYEKTRHNVGFLAIDEIAKTAKKEGDNPAFSKKQDVCFSETTIGGKLVLLVKPMTFMNKSGTALKKFFAYSNMPAHDALSRMVVISDDSDLLEGSIKILENRGSGGHKGVEDIRDNFGSLDFIRIKIGIRPPENTQRAETFVLTGFKEKSPVAEATQNIPEIINVLITKGLAYCQSHYNSLRIAHEP